MKVLLPMFVVATITFGTYKLFELFVRRRERITLVEKLGESLTPEMLKGEINLPAFSTSHTFTALRIGSLLLGMGLGLLLGYLICNTSISGYVGNKDWAVQDLAFLIYSACVLAMGGLGLVVAFIVELKLTRKDK